MLDSNNLIVFEHIPKTAGTTLNHVFIDLLGRENVLSFVKNKKYNCIDLEKFKYAHGHRAQNSLPTKCTEKTIVLVTMLREPIATAHSHISHLSIALKKKYWFLLRIKKFSIEKVIRENSLKDFDNMYIRRILQIDVPFGEINQNHYDRALEKLQSSFDFVFFQHRIEEDLRIFFNLFFDIDLRVKAPISNSGKSKHPLTYSDREFLFKQNAWDMKLYHDMVVWSENRLHSVDTNFSQIVRIEPKQSVKRKMKERIRNFFIKCLDNFF